MSEHGQTVSKVGAGKSIVNRHERIYKRGNLMFIEGEATTEMFIIKSGLVRILKQEGEHAVELAQLGPGSVLGELALLDHQPRSATAQVLEDTSVTVIDEELFTRTLKNIPEWLGNMIQLVVKRLRDTMKRTGEDIVRKSIAGVVQVILLMDAASDKKNAAEKLPAAGIREQVLAVIGLGRLDLENILLHLILKDLVLIKKTDTGNEYLVIKEPDALRLYMQYLRVHQYGGVLAGETLGNAAVELITVLIGAGERNGTAAGRNLIRIGEPQVEIELDRCGKGRFIDRDVLDALIELKLVVEQEDTTESKHYAHSRKTLLFNKDILQNVLMLKKWLPVFAEEIKF